MLVQNPFGDAKPREAVLASRTGKSEAEILVEEVKAEKPKVQPGCVWVAAVNMLRVLPALRRVPAGYHLRTLQSGYMQMMAMLPAL